MDSALIVLHNKKKIGRANQLVGKLMVGVRRSHRARARVRLSLASVGGLVLALPGVAFAQASPTLPPTRDQLRPVAEAPAGAPSVIVDDELERAPCPLADPAYQSVRLTLRSVSFNNLKTFDPADLAEDYRPYLNTEQPVAVLCTIRDAAATRLRRAGLLSAVEIPAQKIEDGNVRFEVINARMTAVRVRGDTVGVEHLIQAHLERLTQEPVFNSRQAERYLMLLNDLPGYDIRLTLKPAGTGPGELIGDVLVARTPLTVDLSVQNLAAKATGRWGGQIRAQANGLTGMGDSTSLAFFSSADFHEQKIFQATHEMRLGGDGLKLAGQLTLAWTKPDIGAPKGTPSLYARTTYATLEASYPLMRTRGQSWWLSGGLDFLNQSVDLVARISEDRLRVGYLKLAGQAIDTARAAPHWRTAGFVELRQGLDIFGAGPNCAKGCPAGVIAPARFDGDPTSTLVRGRAELERSIGGNWAAMFALTGQKAFTPLYSFEEFSGGNYTVGRGYDPSTVIGDSGIGTQFELRGPRYRLGSSGRSRIQPYAFADALWVWNRNVPAGTNPDRLFSVGGGVRLDVTNRARLDLGVAAPLRAAGLSTRRGPVRVLLSLTTRLFPWGDK